MAWTWQQTGPQTWTALRDTDQATMAAERMPDGFPAPYFAVVVSDGDGVEQTSFGIDATDYRALRIANPTEDRAWLLANATDKTASQLEDEANAAADSLFP